MEVVGVRRCGQGQGCVATAECLGVSAGEGCRGQGQGGAVEGPWWEGGVTDGGWGVTDGGWRVTDRG